MLQEKQRRQQNKLHSHHLRQTKRITNALHFSRHRCHILSGRFRSTGNRIIYDESIDGNLSNNYTSPTVVSVGLGSNQFFGTTGRAAPAGTGVIDRDYLTFTIPAGMHLVAIEVLPGTQSDTVGAPVSFIGIRAGNVGSDPTTTPAYTNADLALTLLGYYLYGPADIGNDILDNLAIANTLTPPAQGFTAPLGAGTYTLWIQETVVGNFNYGFDLQVVPEPESLPLLALGLLGLAYNRRRAAAVISE